MTGNFARGVALLLVSSATAAMADAPRSDTSAVDRMRAAMQLDWHKGPAIAPLPGHASVRVPAGEMWLDPAGTSRFLTLSGNLPEGDQVTVAATDLHWFAVIGFDPSGYVRDTDKIDPAKLLQSLRDGQTQTNQARRDKGLDPLEIGGWTVAPHYDPATHNLEWGTRLISPHGENVNYTTRLLGRRGVTSATLVSDSADLPQDLGAFRTALAGFAYAPEDRYEAYAKGDKIAAYGLAALITGGVAAAAVKVGLFKGLLLLLAPLWKLIVGAALAIAAVARRWWARVRGRAAE